MAHPSPQNPTAKSSDRQIARRAERVPRPTAEGKEEESGERRSGEDGGGAPPRNRRAPPPATRDHRAATRSARPPSSRRSLRRTRRPVPPAWFHQIRTGVRRSAGTEAATLFRFGEG
ncbi:pinin-like isoform X1 [Iris pallida]|uniref:Pinin-like isoform X1 n=1 Tax=Iris pallida TaxID=29817 RepID=A0AAX6G525_IRIPA|nr:pinin-like isoform X1 [Iris pallida]